MVEPLHLEPDEFRPPNYTEEQWATFQEEYSNQHHVDSPNRWSNGTKTRRLIDYEHVPHFNYQFLLDVRTEYTSVTKGRPRILLVTEDMVEQALETVIGPTIGVL
jgi:hypothetical protein